MSRVALGALLGLVVLAGAAHAWPIWRNERIDRALRPDEASRVVLAGTVHARLAEVEDPKRPRIVPGLQHIVFRVEHVLLGDAFAVGEHPRFSTRSFEWPEPLVPHEAGTRAFLVVDPEDTRDRIAPFLEHDGRIVTVLPWSGEDPGSASTRRQIQNLVAAELVSALATTTEWLRIRALVLAATPAVSPEQADAAFTPHLDAENAWLRHAVVAGLAYAHPSPENVERAVRDLRAFIRRTPVDARYEERRPGDGGAVVTYGTSAYGMLFAAYGILQSDWRDAEIERLRPLLPLYRVVATELAEDPFWQWHRGIEPLCRLGGHADLSILYDYYASHATRKGGALPETVTVRSAVTRRLTELLDVPYVLTATETGLAGEAEQKALIDAAMARRRADAAD